MHRQRNNIAVLAYEQRQLLSKLLFENRPYDEIRQAAAAAGVTVALHNSTFAAWQKSAEYREYCEVRKGFDASSRANRLAALVQNDGKGPQTLADVAEYELLREIVRLAGAPADVHEATRLAAAIAQLKRGQAAKAAADQDSEVADLKARLAAKDEEIARLRNPQPEDLSGLTEEEKNRRIRERLGIA